MDLLSHNSVEACDLTFCRAVCYSSSDTWVYFDCFSFIFLNMRQMASFQSVCFHMNPCRTLRCTLMASNSSNANPKPKWWSCLHTMRQRNLRSDWYEWCKQCLVAKNMWNRFELNYSKIRERAAPEELGAPPETNAREGASNVENRERGAFRRV